jgi:hypothetical protein
MVYVALFLKHFGKSDDAKVMLHSDSLKSLMRGDVIIG